MVGCALCDRCGLFDAVEISVNVADEEALDLTLPLAQQHNVGVIAKRPLANCLWRCLCPEDRLLRAYWERLQKLRYDFLQSERALEIALRFSLSASGVHTAIVGTTNPRHLREDADFVATGVLATNLLVDVLYGVTDPRIRLGNR